MTLSIKKVGYALFFNQRPIFILLTKSQIKVHLSYLPNSYFYNCTLSPPILRRYRVLLKIRKNKDIVITKPDKPELSS